MDFFHPKAKVNKNHAKKNKKYKDLLQQVSKENQKLFEELVNTGKMIENFAKEEDLVSLENLIEKNKKNLTYLSCFVKEAFLSALFFK